MDTKTFPCRECGKYVEWHTTKAGKRYLAQPWEWACDGHYKMIYPVHRCEPNPQWKEAAAAAELLYVAGAQKEGVIRKGVTVEVIKGRKIPIGTRGVAFWVGEGGYGERVGMMVEGEKVYTALTNVKAAPVEDFPEYVEVLEAEAAAVMARLMGETA